DARFEGSSGDMVGPSVGAGDLDGDGATDVFAGFVGGRERKWSGGVYVLYGPVSGSLSAGDADALLAGEEDNDYAGRSLSIGDTNGDGLDDLWIGTATGGMDTAPPGSAYLLLGSGM
ncbi:MAG: FG-GAP repeat protein, partial [Deltaproteobacteria bacterium]|nr:FG-GAP repeat protein [Deltaproteobacteria bacterium]